MFNIVAGLASIIGLVISIIGLFVAGATLKKVSKIDDSKTVNSIKNSDFRNSNFTGRDKTGHDKNEFY